jgi:hypothetical protein
MCAAADSSCATGRTSRRMNDASLTYRCTVLLGTVLLALGTGVSHAYAQGATRASAEARDSQQSEATAAHTAGTSSDARLLADLSSTPEPLGHCPSSVSVTCGPPPAIITAAAATSLIPKAHPLTLGSRAASVLLLSREKAETLQATGTCPPASSCLYLRTQTLLI